MRGSCRTPIVLLALAGLALAACTSAGQEASPAATSPLAAGVSGGVYLVLGDSIAAGTGASDADATSYPALVRDRLREQFGDELTMESFAVDGQTTENLIEEQLPAALKLLETSDARVITITIGGNDLFIYSADQTCVQNPADPACPLEQGLLELEQRLDRILGELRRAAPQAAVVIQLYPNLFSGTGHDYEPAAEIAFDLLNGSIAGVARRQDVLVADPREEFESKGTDLTHFLDPEPDTHPNDDGYRAIADSFLKALGLD